MDVDKADAEVTTVVENVPTLRSRQVITGVSIEQASDKAFQTAIQDAVAKATGMTSEDVQVTTHTATLPPPTHPSPTQTAVTLISANMMPTDM